ncbi:hemerythrin domain-containing protein [Cohnella pontilimi]|nr:hemerythrin domain-containing protein [Cohnella pontilimi]
MERKDSPLLELYLNYDEWKEEHDALQSRLLELCRLMKWNPGNYEHANWEAHHRKVKDLWFLPFMRDWKRHLAKERNAIYPIAQSAICGGKMGPAAVLEQDGRIAETFFQEYLDAVKSGAPPEEALALLLQVLMIVAEHFRVEDESVVPVTEKLMEEIEYNRC